MVPIASHADVCEPVSQLRSGINGTHGPPELFASADMVGVTSHSVSHFQRSFHGRLSHPKKRAPCTFPFVPPERFTCRMESTLDNGYRPLVAFAPRSSDSIFHNHASDISGRAHWLYSIPDSAPCIPTPLYGGANADPEPSTDSDSDEAVSSECACWTFGLGMGQRVNRQRQYISTHHRYHQPPVSGRDLPRITGMRVLWTLHNQERQVGGSNQVSID